MDTDSFTLRVATRGIQKDLHNLRKNFDFSNLPTSHNLYDVSNKAKLFRFKEEFGCAPIHRFVGLRSKCYAFEVGCDHKNINKATKNCDDCHNKNVFTKNTLKGVTQTAQKHITFENYLNILQQGSLMRSKQTTIKSHEHQMSTVETTKISLSAFDDKFFQVTKVQYYSILFYIIKCSDIFLYVCMFTYNFLNDYFSSNVEFT